MRRGLACALLMALLGAAPGGQRDASPPALVVLIVVDQMRADYVPRFRDDWTGGLKRLVTTGAWFSKAAYPYLNTVTCPGHATIATGAFPPRHGIVQNTWYDRGERQVVTCTDDPRARTIPYGRAPGTARSARFLRTPTLGDELRTRRGGRVVSLSLKARSAIMMAGHGGDAVTWLSDSLDGWETSSAYSSGPVPAVRAYIEAHPIDADYGQAWTRLLPPDRYQEPDAVEGEAPPRGWTPIFPHLLRGAPGDSGPGPAFYAQWERSPYANLYIARLAASLVEAMGLGRGTGVDMLAVGFSSTDLVGHAFGPRSQEVRDVYAHLDRALGELFDRLDALVGPERYIVGLSADHGVGELPEQLAKAGRDGGRLTAARVADVVETVARASVGAGRYVNRVGGNDVYFEAGMYDRMKTLPGAIGAIIKALESQPGIARVFRAEDLRGSPVPDDPLRQAAARGYVQGRSGDLILALKPGWMFIATGTTHGSANAYDREVPLLLMGPGIKPGEYAEPASPADLAPSLAALVGITLPQAQGRVLRSAFLGSTN